MSRPSFASSLARVGPAETSDLADRLIAALGSTNVDVLDGPDRDERTAEHASGLGIGVPFAWLRARDAAGVAAVVDVGRASGRRVVVVGEATTFWDGLDVDGALVLDARALEGPLDIDAEARVAHVGAGRTLRAIDDAARAFGLCLVGRPDAGGDTSAGSLLAVGCAAGLGSGLGPPVDQVLGALVVTGRGEALRLGASGALHGRFDQALGIPDALSLLVAAEGRGAVIVELGLALAPAPRVVALRGRLPLAGPPDAAALSRLLARAREEVDRGGVDTFRVEAGLAAAEAKAVPEVFARAFSLRGTGAAEARARELAHALSDVGVEALEFTAEPEAAYRGESAASDFHWAYGVGEHRRRLRGSAFSGVEVTAAWGSPLRAALDRASLLLRELGAATPVHRHLSVYVAPRTVTVGVHVASARTPEAVEQVRDVLSRAQPALVACGVPYRTGAFFRDAVDRHVVAGDAVVTQRRTDELLAHLDPAGILGSAAPRRRSR